MNEDRTGQPEFSPEDERRATRATYILYAVMIIFIVLPPALAWALGLLGKK